jgi:CotS family spore coat protein
VRKLLGNNEIKAVLEHYHIYPPEIVPRGKVFKIYDGIKYYALKKVEMAPAKLLFFLSSMDYLWDQGFHTMSRLIKSSQGEMYVEEAGSLFFLTEWVEGRYVNLAHPPELKKAVQLLADMHLKGEGFHPLPGCIQRNDIGQWEKKWQRRMKDLEKMAVLCKKETHTFDFIFRKTVQDALIQGSRALQLLASLGYKDYCRELEKKKPLCHRDFVYHNMIYSGAEIFLIDFEYCVQDSRVIDLARFIRTGWLRHPWEVGRSLEIVDLYNRYYPLSSIEYRLLEAVLMFPHDVWRCGHRWYFSGQRKNSILKGLRQEYDYHNRKWEVLKKLNWRIPR